MTGRSLADGHTVSVQSDAGWREVSFHSTAHTAVCTLSENNTLPGVTVTLTALCAENRVTWYTNLASENREYSLYSCDYPVLAFDRKPAFMMFSPYGCGELHRADGEIEAFLPYPSFLASMQYFAVYHEKCGRGLYYGIHDPAPAYKNMQVRMLSEQNAAVLQAQMMLSAVDQCENSQPLSGSCVWELFDGGWYDAAMLYRTWAVEHAQWMPVKSASGRTDLPEWMRLLPHWWRVKLTDGAKEIDELLQAQKELGVTSAVHLYNWHEIPFDNDYPHYFPPKKSFKTSVSRLQGAGVRVMPYINGRLWDTRDGGTADEQFTRTAKPYCTKNREGEPITETYGSKEADGSDVRLAAMCPSTALWQEKVTEIVRTLAEQYGVDGVYIDQIAAAAPVICEDSAHMHPAGGGTWWCAACRNLLDHVKRAVPADFVLTTEGSSEPFMKQIQAYLSWIWLRNGQVPAFQAIYSDSVVSFGRNYSHFVGDDDFLLRDDGVSQRMIAAQSLTYGEQMGWMDPHVYLGMKHRDFYRKCVKARETLTPFFTGRLLRSPEVEDGRVPLRSDRIYYYDTDVLEHGPSYSELWEKNGKRLLMLVNAGEEQAVCTVCGEFPDGSFRLLGDSQEEFIVSDGRFQVTLPPLSVNYCIW